MGDDVRARLGEGERRLIQIEVAALRAGHVHMRDVFGVVERILAARAAAPDERLCSQCGERYAAMVKIGTTDGWCTTCLDEAAEPAPDGLREAVEGLAAEIEQGVAGGLGGDRSVTLANIARRLRDIAAHPTPGGASS